jgi:nucleotide-binding universal stress UspA family protein
MLTRPFSSTIVLAMINERHDEALSRAESRVRQAGLEVETVLASGLVPDMLLALADDTEAVAIGRRGRGPGSGAIGEETARILRRSPRPLLVGGEQPSPCLAPLVAYDGGETSGQALSLAARYAEMTKVIVEVVHVADAANPDPETLARAGVYLSGRGVEYVTRELHGPVVETISAHAVARGADLLLAGAHSGRRRRSWSIGSAAEQLVRASHIPAIVVR